MTKQFYIYFSGSNDALKVVWKYHNTASAEARQTGQTVFVADVDVDTASKAEKEFWNGSKTIECVSVKNGVVNEREVYPSLERIRASLFSRNRVTNG